MRKKQTNERMKNKRGCKNRHYPYSKEETAPAGNLGSNNLTIREFVHGLKPYEHY